MRRTHGPIRAVGAVASAVLIMNVLVAAPAGAVSINLCTGILKCLSLSLGDSGYSTVQTRANWGMTPGTNCTNYVGYRLNSGGRLTARPPGLSTAHSWGSAARSAGIAVRSVPTVGSVAWWAKDVPPASKLGHVAYVERTYADGSFDVSEDSFNGDFGWRHVKKKEAGWPSGFISFPQSDGTPSGRLTSLTSPRKDTLDLWGWGSDPEAMGRSTTILLSVGGPRTSRAARTYTTSTTYFRFHRILRSSSMPSGRRTVYVYLLNASGTKGASHAFIGKRTVRIR